MINKEKIIMENRDYTTLRTALFENENRTEEALVSLFLRSDEDIDLVFDAQKYSLLGGGKRIRPFIVNAACRVLGGAEEVSMPIACAVEMVHTYSLIHDDLPCMDDDDFRRGKPANHKAFGYANALLAGDALLTNAFRVIATSNALSAEIKADAVALLARASGDCGMIGGQIMDLYGETEELEFEKLLKLHTLKTGSLMECSARLGALAAGYAPDSEESKRLAGYAKKIGISFQVIDDVLDAVADNEQLGKSAGSDAEHNKTTFMTYYSVDEAIAYAKALTAEAVDEIRDMPNSSILIDLAYYLLERQK